MGLLVSETCPAHELVLQQHLGKLLTYLRKQMQASSRELQGGRLLEHVSGIANMTCSPPSARSQRMMHTMFTAKHRPVPTHRQTPNPSASCPQDVDATVRDAACGALVSIAEALSAQTGGRLPGTLATPVVKVIFDCLGEQKKEAQSAAGQALLQVCGGCVAEPPHRSSVPRLALRCSPVTCCTATAGLTALAPCYDHAACHHLFTAAAQAVGLAYLLTTEPSALWFCFLPGVPLLGRPGPGAGQAAAAPAAQPHLPGCPRAAVSPGLHRR